MKKQVLKTEKGREFIGKVVSTKMKDTIIVAVERFFLHPLYKKPVKKTKRFAVHAPNHSLKIGDVVIIKETRPISKTKHFLFLRKNEI
ncbi:MAG: 30S ribosomal protein S17 [Patescibacteria group bacterium]|nr:30S ribosomal protein S17 [Patescibacteria group bacterium]